MTTATMPAGRSARGRPSIRSSTSGSSETGNSRPGDLRSIVRRCPLCSILALPVFLQRVLRYTAREIGRLVFPGAMASAFTMAAMSRVVGKIDVRYSIFIGAFLSLASMIGHSHFTAQTAQSDLFWR